MDFKPGEYIIRRIECSPRPDKIDGFFFPDSGKFIDVDSDEGKRILRRDIVRVLDRDGRPSW